MVWILRSDHSGPDRPRRAIAAAIHTEFYKHCAARLKPGSLLSLHVASPFAQPERVLTTLTHLAQAFSVVRPYMVSIPLSGRQWMMACASQSVNPAELNRAKADSAIRHRGLSQLQHYNGHTRQAAMALPNFVRKIVKTTGARRSS